MNVKKFFTKEQQRQIVEAIKLAEKLSKGVIVAIAPDGGEKYLSSPVWD